MTVLNDPNSKFINNNQSSKGHNYKNEKLEMRRRKLQGLLDKENEIYDSEISSKNFEREKNRNIEQYTQEKNTKLEIESNHTKIINHQFEKEIRANQELKNKNRGISGQSTNRPLTENKKNYEKFNEELPKCSLWKQTTRIEEELDNNLCKYTQNLEKLKYEDFLIRKKMQDDLLSNINIQMDKLKYGLNDKSYEEKAAQEWIREYTEKINNYEHNSYMNFSNLIRSKPSYNDNFNNNYMQIKSPLLKKQGSNYINTINKHTTQNYPILEQQIHTSNNINPYYNRNIY